MSLGSVLVLDNDRDQAQRVANMLHKQQWTSVLSFDQRMALRMLKSSRFHLMLFDAVVGGVSTLNLADDFRQQSQDAPLAIMAEGHMRLGGKPGQSSAVATSAADFIITKPFSQDKLKTLLDDTNQYHRARSKDHHVLVVDDDLHLRRHLCGVLNQVGYKVSAAANMEDAFFDHNLGLIDVVITAILIPGIGGIAGTAQIRKDWPHIQVIAMSQGVDDKITAMHVLAAAKEAGAQALLPKPFVMPELLRTVGSVIRARGGEPPSDEVAQTA